MTVPKHVGIIIDGNRRFAKQLMLKPWKGHEWGARKVEALFDWCQEAGVKELTLYAFSVENFDRPKAEFDYIMKVFKKEFTDLLNDERLDKEKIRVNFIGRLKMFPEGHQKLFKEIMEKTKDNNNFTINFAMAYGGRAEIIDATRKIAKQIKENKL